MEPITHRFLPIIKEMMALSKEAAVITGDNVYQEANLTIRPYFFKIISELMLPGSRILNSEKLVELKRLADEGHACMILMEHYSNFDLPNLVYLLEAMGPEGKKVADAVVAIAGFKLNTESHLVRAFTEAFSRIVIYPSRSLAGITDPEELEREQALSRAINMASMRALSQAKSEGKIVLVFPSGTRYRIGVPETKKGVKEVDSYIKSFDYFVPVSINGNLLHINPKKGMDEDLVNQDVVMFNAGEVTSCKTFRESAMAGAAAGEDPKQAVVDRVMALLDDLHASAETVRQAEPGAQPQEPDFSGIL